jgi:hypothetical protein
MSVCCVAAEESSALPQSPFVTAKVTNINYDIVSGTGMVENGSEVSIKVVLKDFVKEIEGDKSELFLYSDLQGPVWGISLDGVSKEFRSPFTIDHGKVTEAYITLTGKAPEVYKREDNVTLLRITQKVKEEYAVIDIENDVTSEMIESALKAWHNAREAIEVANESIAKANATGVNVKEATKSLELANEHLSNSLDFYNSGRQEEALEEAQLAFVSAEEAKKLAEGAKSASQITNYGIIAAVVVIAVVILVFLLMQRMKKRRIY